MSSTMAMLRAAVVVLAATLVAGKQVCTDFTCPEPNGFFAHPSKCHSYVKCEGGHYFEETCPANLHYNEATGQCDDPENANCDIAQRQEEVGCSLTRPMKAAKHYTDPTVECDCECCRKPHRDCNKYYECKNHTAYVKECGVGLVFNPNNGNCDYSSNYNCPETIQCGCHCRYPVVGQCDAFYKCEDGVAEKDYCSAGLLFNPDTLQCDNANAVECPGPDVTDPTGPPPEVCGVNVVDHYADCKFWAANNDCNCKWTDGDCSWQKFVARACPRSCRCEDKTPATTSKPDEPIITTCIDCSSGQQYWEHPTNCEMFIQCAPYGPQEMPCGPGTRWNQTLLTCDHTWRTACVTNDYKKEDGSCVKPTLPIVDPTQGPTPCGDDAVDHDPDCKFWAANNDCVCKWTDGDCSWQNHVARTCPRSCCGADKPATSKPSPPPPTSCIDCSSGQQYWEHPTNCEMFIQCAPYGPQEMPCGPGTRWNQTLLTCDHTWRTACVTNDYKNTDGSCQPPPPPPPPTQPPPPPPTTNPECKLECPKYTGLFPHPNSCNKWVHCDHHIPYVKDCPANLHFNPDLKVCDWPDRAGCKADEGGQCGAIVPPTDPTLVIPDPDCTCACCHLESEDCTSYYYCDESQTKTFHTCSEGLVFNPELSTCVYAEDYPECEPEQPPKCECDCFYASQTCSEYYNCENGLPVKYECPLGLHWNQDKKTCDHPENVGCGLMRK